MAAESSAANLPELRCVDPTRHETHEWEDGWTRYRCPGSPDARSAAYTARPVKCRRYKHGGARFYVMVDGSERLLADTYNAEATEHVALALHAEVKDA